VQEFADLVPAFSHYVKPAMCDGSQFTWMLFHPGIDGEIALDSSVESQQFPSHRLSIFAFEIHANVAPLRKERKEGPSGFAQEHQLLLNPMRSATVCNVMVSNATESHDPADLGELERSIMRLVWQHGELTAEQVRQELNRPLKESTVRTVLRRLEEKGYLAHTATNRTFLYRPLEAPQLVAGRAVRRIIDWFCDGSVESLLVGMVDSRVLDREELKRLATRIAGAKKGKK
jgi:BlaI family transcriptional regulator, penicillinase repressor